MILRLILIKLHLYLGLTGGALLCVIAATGTVYAFEPQLRSLWSETIDPWRPETMLSPNQLSGAIREMGVDGAATAYRWPDHDAAGVWVIWKDGEGQRQDFMLDPTTGERLPRAEAARAFFHGVLEVHRTLTMGEVGQKVVGLSALSLAVLTVSGLFIGVRRWREAKRVWLPGRKERTSRSPYVRWRLWHRWIGAWAAPWLLIMPVTGMVWSFDAYEAFLKSLGGPERFPTRPAVSALEPSEDPAVLDRIWKRCLAEVSEQTTMRLMMPSAPGQAVHFEWSPPELVSFAMRSRLFFDSADGALVEEQRWEDFSSGEQLVRWAFPVHTGRVFGVWGQTLVFIGSLSIPFFFASGLCLYLKRKRKAGAIPAISNLQANEKINAH